MKQKHLEDKYFLLRWISIGQIAPVYIKFIKAIKYNLHGWAKS